MIIIIRLFNSIYLIYFWLFLIFIYLFYFLIFLFLFLYFSIFNFIILLHYLISYLFFTYLIIYLVFSFLFPPFILSFLWFISLPCYCCIPYIFLLLLSPSITRQRLGRPGTDFLVGIPSVTLCVYSPLPHAVSVFFS